MYTECQKHRHEHRKKHRRKQRQEQRQEHGQVWLYMCMNSIAYMHASSSVHVSERIVPTRAKGTCG